jgi:16S rRNA U516 pseudouridylate synthase RsuA-like enzyme
VRTRIGPLSIAGLYEGAWRHLRPKEVAALAGGKGR